jgi:type I restriction enzyme S subunit
VFDDNVYVDMVIPERAKVKSGDILICVRNGSRDLIGKCALLDSRVEGEAFGAFMSVYRSSHSNYVFHQFQSNIVQRQIRENLGATINQITSKQLNSFLIPLPVKPEERDSIVAVLAGFNGLIASLEKLIAKKRAIKQGAMQELLTGKRRLPGFNGKWETKKLGEIAEIYQPLTISQEQFTDDGYLVYGANGIVGRYHKYNHELWQTTITCRGSTCGTVNKTVDKSWITGNAMVMNVDSNDSIDKLFFYFLLFKQDFKNCITGSGQPQIVRAPLAEFEVSFPKEKAEQQAIAQVLSDMDTEIEQLEQGLTKYKMLKQGMMQVLLTGKVRLA